MIKLKKNGIGKIRAITIFLFVGFAVCGFLNSRLVSGFELNPKPTPKKQTQKPKFTDFSHSVRQHSNLACSSCHKFPSGNWKSVRKKTEAFPDVTEYPKHESCLSCHRQQFFGSAKPTICSICHTNPSPNNSTRHPFPNPREVFDLSAKGKQAISDFAVSFPHDKHIEIVTQNRILEGEWIRASFTAKPNLFSEESCSVCHQTLQPQGKSDDEFITKPPAKLGDGFWLKKGTFKTSPVNHAKCFSCHSAETGILPAPQTCATCHKLAPKQTKTDFDAKFASTVGDLDKTTLLAWRKRDSSATFRHEFSSHSDLECASCHNAATINTLDFATKKVAVTSCNMCHITATSDDGGILNFEIDARKKDAKFQCVKCHIAFGKLPIPESHFKAVAAAGN